MAMWCGLSYCCQLESERTDEEIAEFNQVEIRKPESALGEDNGTGRENTSR